ncbi:MAG: dynamin family protein [Candidatus Promineifilaceae bacterium]
MQTILTTEQEELLKRTRDTLGRLRDILADLKAPYEDREALAESIRQLDELFLLVVAGEFNSGKSSFINAILGTPLLVEGVTPTTSQIYLLKYGSESQQKPIEKGIWEQSAPIELLRSINIVDTPGTNAILREHEALTTEFIPRSDLVLFVSSADRPFTESERQFLDKIREWGKKIVIVINKIDILSNDSEVQQILDFVRQAARDLLGSAPPIFAISSKRAQRAKAGDPRLWSSSGLEPLETYIRDTLDESGRFRLKLLNPLGVGHKLVKKQLELTDADLSSLERDTSLLADVDKQMTLYGEDMQRNFQSRLSEISNLLYDMEMRGRNFFDEHLRLFRMPDLLRKDHIRQKFETEVVGQTPLLIERRVGEMVDWMVEQDLRQWTAVAEHLTQRRQQHDERIIGQGGPKEGTLAYDRQRLVDSIGRATHEAVASYDQRFEANQLADVARKSVIETAGLTIGGASLGALIALATHVAFLDATGIIAGITAVTLGLLILPARRRKANQELSAKLSELRQRLTDTLGEQFDREMRRGRQRIEDTIAPFSRFVRAENQKLQAQREHVEELEAHIAGLRAQLGG